MFVLKEINKAKQLYDRFGESIWGDKTSGSLLIKYRTAIMRSGSMIKDIGIADACSNCAKTKLGSCCSPEVENWYDCILLFINTLLGVQLPEKREIEGHCFFVGSKGCKLLARYSFGVNYLCHDLKTFLGPSLSAEFLSVVGDELYCGWQTEQSIRNWLDSHKNQ